MRKSLVLYILLLATLLLALAPVQAQDDVTEIRFMNWWDASREVLMLDLIARFEAENPDIRVINEVQPWDNRAELVSTAISSTTPPHIIMTNRQETFQFAGLGLIRPIDEFVAESGLDLSLFYDGEVGNQYWAGELYALPLPTAGGLTGMFFYNKDMLAAAGIDGPPATWQELEAAAQAINVGDAMGIDILGANSGSSAGDFITWLYTNNGRYVDDLGRVLMFNNAEGVETLEWMIRFTNDINGGIENITDFFQGADFTTSDHPWYRSEYAFNPINTSHFNHMNKVAPDFFAATDSWGVMMRPYNGNNPDAKTAGVVGYSSSGGWGYTIPVVHTPELQAAAYRFAEFLGASDQGGCVFLFAQGRPSPVRACNENPAYYDANPYWDVVLEGLSNDVAVQITPVQGQLHDILHARIEEAFYGVMSAEDALNAAAEEMQAILDEFWSGLDG
jgi:ABC-type glycerol-3-phosphate transport system substrate-binding protein